MDGLGLDACGLTSDARGRLSVNKATFQTSVPFNPATLAYTAKMDARYAQVLVTLTFSNVGTVKVVLMSAGFVLLGYQLAGYATLSAG